MNAILYFFICFICVLFAIFIIIMRIKLFKIDRVKIHNCSFCVYIFKATIIFVFSIIIFELYINLMLVINKLYIIIIKYLNWSYKKYLNIKKN